MRTIALLILATLSLACATGGPAAGPAVSAAERTRMKKTILVKSGWQSVNIGDAGHTPGILQLLERHAPEAHVIVWPNDDNPAIDAMIAARFPKAEIVRGTVEPNGPTGELKAAFHRADLLLHGSGPSVVAQSAIEAWRTHTHKPYGIYGVTIATVTPQLKDILDHAAFVFTRETDSLKIVREAGVACPVLDFAPDACVAIDVRDDAKALPWMRRNGLEERKYLCVVPRLRKTPYYWSKPGVTWTQEKIHEIEDINYRYRQEDLAKVREIVTEWVRKTGQKVMLCPEMVDVLALMGPEVYAPLPDDVRPHVVIRDRFWLPDEAASIYARAFALVSLDCHSPLIAYPNATPALYVRLPPDALKARMYHDFGMSDWFFEIEKTQPKQILERLEKIRADYPAALAYLAQGNERIAAIHRETIARAMRAAFGK